MTKPKKPKPKPCGFIVAWAGKCKHPRPCPIHKGLKCWACKAYATRECSVASSLVCGMPECDQHSHEGVHYAYLLRARGNA